VPWIRRIASGVALALARYRAATDDAARPAGGQARPHASVHEPGRGSARVRPPAMSEHGDMACAHVHDVAAELALGALTGRELAAALAHLDTCRACREDVRRLMVIGGRLLELLPPAAPPAGFETRVVERLAAASAHG
jgi:hypothetical protein